MNSIHPPVFSGMSTSDGARSPTTTIPRKRRRPALSCIQCRQRKIKCDREDPCGPCQKYGSEAACQFSDDSSRRSRTTSSRNRESTEMNQTTNVTVEPNQPVLRTAAGNTPLSLVGSGSGTNTVRTQDDSENVPWRDAFEDLKARMGRLERSVGRNEQSSVSTQQINSLEETIRDFQSHVESTKRNLAVKRDAQSASTDLPGSLSIAPTAARLGLGKDKVRLFGPSHFVHSLNHLEVFSRYKTRNMASLASHPTWSSELSGRLDRISGLSHPTWSSELSGLLDRISGMRRALKQQSRFTSFDPCQPLRDLLPDKSLCDQLVRLYMRTFEPIYRLLHITSFWKSYDNFWSSSGTAPSSFTITLILMLAIGGACYQDMENYLYVRCMVGPWYHAGQWWLTGPMYNALINHEGVQIHCLLIIAQQANALGRSGTVAMEAGSLLQHAYTVGLHRDPDKFADIPFHHSQLRRRLWVTVLELVLQASADSGLPSTLASTDFDCQAPSNLNDEEFDSPSPTILPSEEFTQTSIQLLLWKSFPVRLRAVQIINGFRSAVLYNEVLDVTKKLRESCLDIDRFMKSTSSVGKDCECSPQDFHRKVLDLINRRLILLLHRPFMAKAREDPRFHFSRKVGFDTAMLMISYLDDYTKGRGALDDFTQLSSVASGIYKSPIGVDVVSTIVVELMHRAREESTENSIDESSFIAGINETSRKELLAAMDRLSDQLFQLVQDGQPTLQRYFILNVSLLQVRAIYAGASPDTAMKEGLLKLMRKGEAGFSQHIRQDDPSGAGAQNRLERPSLGQTFEFDANFDIDALMRDLENNVDIPTSWLLPMWDETTMSIL